MHILRFNFYTKQTSPNGFFPTYYQQKRIDISYRIDEIIHHHNGPIGKVARIIIENKADVARAAMRFHSMRDGVKALYYALTDTPERFKIRKPESLYMPDKKKVALALEDTETGELFILAQGLNHRSYLHTPSFFTDNEVMIITKAIKATKAKLLDIQNKKTRAVEALRECEAEQQFFEKYNR